MTDWRIREITNDDAREMSSWIYDEPYSLYNASPDDTDWVGDYSTVVDANGRLVAHICFGIDARVPGGNYDEDATDIGAGMRPDLTGEGRGRMLLDLLTSEAQRRWPGKPLRTTIAAFNERAQHLVRKAGFRETQIFRNPAGREFVVFVRD